MESGQQFEIMDTSGHYIKGTGDFEIKELSAQDSVLKDLDKGKQYWECMSAGTFAEIQPYAYGSGRFWLYKGGDANYTRINFINPADVWGVDPTEGYMLQLRNDESVEVGNPNTSKFRSPASYISLNTWYEFKWERTLDGEFYIYIKGGSFGIEDWTLIDDSVSGSNPFTDNIYTESVYQVLDLDIGDKYIPGVQRDGVEQ